MINININISKKTIIMLSAVLSFFTIANYVSIVDAESNGGVTVVQETTPVGTVAMWGGGTPPTDWLEMNGQSTSGYSELASIYGANLPDLRGEFVRGWDNGRGVDSSRTIGSSQLDAFQGHRHGVLARLFQRNIGSKTAGADQDFLRESNAVIGDPITDGTNGTPRTASETRPRNVALMYIVKAK